MNPSPGGVRRRTFLGYAGVGVLGASVPSLTQPARAAPRFAADPFGMGVASGDPLPGGVVLWTRIAPDPVAADGRGGVPEPNRPLGVAWEISTRESFGRRDIVRRGTAIATPELGHSIHVEVDGLRPDRMYWYRFRVGDEISPVGRTRTAPAEHAALRDLTFAFVSCQNYPGGHFTALRHLADDDLDVAFHLGDYIYEGDAQGSLGRGHLPAAETFSLADYRVRYGQYKSDPDLRAAHESVAFVVVPDDHEVENNWAGAISEIDDEPDQDPEVFLRRRAAAFQAYYENLPLRRTSMPDGPDMQLYRSLGYGRLVDFHLLDTRQYRSDQATDDTNNQLRWDPGRTLLGDRQERWLVRGMDRSRASWNVLAQQSKVVETDDTEGKGESYSTDNWDGYAYSRARLFDAVHERGIDNMVVISGDAHVSIVGDLMSRSKDPDSPVVGAEFLGTSVTSGGDGANINPAGERRMRENPHLYFYNARRGYQRCVATRYELRVDYLVLPYVTAPGAPPALRGVGYVERGRPGVAQWEDKVIV